MRPLLSSCTTCPYTHAYILFAGHACTYGKAFLASSGAELWPLQASRLVDERDATDRAERRSGQCQCECQC